MRKQYGLKFDEDDVQRWDDYAALHGLTRTTFLETAAERMISETKEALPEVRAESQGSPEEDHLARPGIRRAWICGHTDRNGVRDCNRRTFLSEEPEDHVPDCPEHGKMIRQPNRSYFGQDT